MSVFMCMFVQSWGVLLGRFHTVWAALKWTQGDFLSSPVCRPHDSLGTICIDNNILMWLLWWLPVGSFTSVPPGEERRWGAGKPQTPHRLNLKSKCGTKAQMGSASASSLKIKQCQYVSVLKSLLWSDLISVTKRPNWCETNVMIPQQKDSR